MTPWPSLATLQRAREWFLKSSSNNSRSAKLVGWVQSALPSRLTGASLKTHRRGSQPSIGNVRQTQAPSARAMSSKVLIVIKKLRSPGHCLSNSSEVLTCFYSSLSLYYTNTVCCSGICHFHINVHFQSFSCFGKLLVSHGATAIRRKAPQPPNLMRLLREEGAGF